MSPPDALEQRLGEIQARHRAQRDERERRRQAFRAECDRRAPGLLPVLDRFRDVFDARLERIAFHDDADPTEDPHVDSNTT